eukprot:3859604-Rhodomonas_salina.1
MASASRTAFSITSFRIRSACCGRRAPNHASATRVGVLCERLCVCVCCVSVLGVHTHAHAYPLSAIACGFCVGASVLTCVGRSQHKEGHGSVRECEDWTLHAAAALVGGSVEGAQFLPKIAGKEDQNRRALARHRQVPHAQPPERALTECRRISVVVNMRETKENTPSIEGCLSRRRYRVIAQSLLATHTFESPQPSEPVVQHRKRTSDSAEVRDNAESGQRTALSLPPVPVLLALHSNSTPFKLCDAQFSFLVSRCREASADTPPILLAPPTPRPADLSLQD